MWLESVVLDVASGTSKNNGGAFERQKEKRIASIDGHSSSASFLFVLVVVFRSENKQHGCFKWVWTNIGAFPQRYHMLLYFEIEISTPKL